MPAPRPDFSSPLFAPLRPWLACLPAAPDCDAVAALAERFPIVLPNGKCIRFVPPPEDGLSYEARLWASGAVATRPANWHDFFNALVWLSFPRAKLALSAGHARATGESGGPRGAHRDALTHFDECGIVVVSSQPDLLTLLREFRWKALFVERRADVRAAMRFFVFGHATYEALLQPYYGLAAKAILFAVDADWLALSDAAQLSAVDAMLAAELDSGRHARPRDFSPLPLLGIPGVTADSEETAYYDDVRQFRPGWRHA